MIVLSKSCRVSLSTLLPDVRGCHAGLSDPSDHQYILVSVMAIILYRQERTDSYSARSSIQRVGQPCPTTTCLTRCYGLRGYISVAILTACMIMLFVTLACDAGELRTPRKPCSRQKARSFARSLSVNAPEALSGSVRRASCALTLCQQPWSKNPSSPHPMLPRPCTTPQAA